MISYTHEGYGLTVEPGPRLGYIWKITICDRCLNPLTTQGDAYQ